MSLAHSPSLSSVKFYDALEKMLTLVQHDASCAVLRVGALISSDAGGRDSSPEGDESSKATLRMLCPADGASARAFDLLIDFSVGHF